MGFSDPTPIQLRAFPIILAGKDLIGTAQTGTGKTAAFALPILTLLAEHGAFRCLVLEPTRELAAQVETAFRDYGRFTDLRVSVVHGGVGYGKQREEAARGTDIVCATPGPRPRSTVTPAPADVAFLGHVAARDRATRCLGSAQPGND